MNHQKNLLAPAVVFLIGTTGAQGIKAQESMDKLEEIVVTAERRSSTEQRTAAALTVKTGDDMLEQGRYTLSNILEGVPGITGGEALNSGASGGSGTDNPASGLVFRGIPSNLGTGGSVTSTASAAAIYVDDVYNGIGGNYDIERIEVLRGPQGTLYGRSATSGVVATHTEDPNTSDWSGDVALETGSASLQHYTGALNIPILQDKLALRVSGNYYERNGYWINPGEGRKSEDLRAKLLYTPTDNFSLLIGYAKQDNVTESGGGIVDQPTPDQFVFNPNPVWGTGENNFNQYWARVDLDLGAVALTYIPAVREWEQDTVTQLTGALAGVQTLRVPLSKFVTHELRFTSDYESTFQWQFGGTYYDNKLSDFNELIASSPPAPGLRFRSELHEKQTTAYGAFAEAIWSFLPDTRLTLGLRYDHTEVQVDQSYTSLTLQTRSLSGPAAFREFDNTTYKVRLEHDLTESNLIYGMVSTGFSPGDIALGTDASFTPEVVELDAEVLTAYEVGSKNRFLDNQLQVNGAIYYNDYSAYQLANVNFGSPVIPRFTSIALPLTSLGAELEIVALPWTGGTFGLNLSYTDSKFDLGGIETTGDKEFARNRFYTDRVYGIPKFRGSLSYDHRFEFNGNIALLLHGDVVYNSEHDTQRITVDEANAGYVPYVNQSAQAVGNLSGTLQLADGRYGITGYVRNVTDEEYKATGNGPSILSPTGSATLADPRAWGMILRAKF